MTTQVKENDSVWDNSNHESKPGASSGRENQIRLSPAPRSTLPAAMASARTPTTSTRSGLVLTLISIVAAILIGAGGLAVALAPPAPDPQMHRISVGGVERSYYLHVPRGLPPSAPLVIMLHGDLNEGRTVVRDYGWENQAEKDGFVIAGPDGSRIYPDGTPSYRNYRGWNSGIAGGHANRASSDDVGFIAAMIDDIERSVGTDPRRVYVAGYSSGGNMANRLGQEMARRLAAISTSGNVMVPGPRTLSHGIPVLFSAGDRDPQVPRELSWRVTTGGGVLVKEGHRDLVNRWRALDACPAAHTIPGPKNTIVEASGPCRDGSEVRYVLMRGVRHKWPTGDPIDLTQMSWDFFRRFSLPDEPVALRR